MSTAQTRAHSNYRQADEKVEKFMAEAIEKIKRKRGEFACTADQIRNERDTKGLSWRQVAVNLGLGSPGGARAAYTALTGRPHSDAAPTTNRATRSNTGASGQRLRTTAPEWNDDTDQDLIMDAITHRDIVVRRVAKGIPFPDESVHVAKIVRFAYDGANGQGDLIVHVFTKEQCQCRLADPRDADSGVSRCFRVADVKEVIGWTQTNPDAVQ